MLTEWKQIESQWNVFHYYKNYCLQHMKNYDKNSPACDLIYNTLHLPLNVIYDNHTSVISHNFTTSLRNCFLLKICNNKNLRWLTAMPLICQQFYHKCGSVFISFKIWNNDNIIWAWSVCLQFSNKKHKIKRMIIEICTNHPYITW